jgi:hypothetical protein
MSSFSRSSILLGNCFGAAGAITRDLGLLSQKDFSLVNKVVRLVEHNLDDEALGLRALRKRTIWMDEAVVQHMAEVLDYLLGTGIYAQRDSRSSPVISLLRLKLPKIGDLEVLRPLRANERAQFPWLGLLLSPRNGILFRATILVRCAS